MINIQTNVSGNSIALLEKEFSDVIDMLEYVNCEGGFTEEEEKLYNKFCDLEDFYRVDTRKREHRTGEALVDEINDCPKPYTAPVIRGIGAE